MNAADQEMDDMMDVDFAVGNGGFVDVESGSESDGVVDEIEVETDDVDSGDGESDIGCESGSDGVVDEIEAETDDVDSGDGESDIGSDGEDSGSSDDDEESSSGDESEIGSDEEDEVDGILVAYLAGVLNDEEFANLMVVAANGGVRRERYLQRWEPFDFDVWSEEECRVDTRFRKEDVLKLVDLFGLGEEIVTYNRVRVDSVEALCLLLRRLAFPCRFVDLMAKFGRPKETLCVIFNHMLNHIYHNFSHLLTSFNQQWLSPQRLTYYAERVAAKGAPLANCWGFIDGTLRPIARPKQNQRVMYNGHKRVHGFKFQSISAPNGLIANFFGPLEGSRHDSYLLAQSGILDALERHSVGVNGEVLCVYGDPAYPLSEHIQTGFPNAQPEDQVEYNRAMSSVRVSVEWCFGEIVERFRFTDFKKMMKTGLSPVAKQYAVSALLQNCHNCLYSSKCAQFFECDPPALEDYLQPI